MTFGENLKNVRKGKKLTQCDMAKQLGISQNYLSDIENDNRDINIKRLIVFANKLNISVSMLMNDNIK
ncbi:XRE family transcriptional regulator [Staphylococcus succinus]|nr:XRE family transcriptional regulator [Staphylococcus succinus]